MRNEARKLTIFTTRNMKALLTTEDLDPVMSKLGFITAVNHSTPPSTTTVDGGAAAAFTGWREYVFNGKWARVKSLNQTMPMAVVPHPRIDGLHESVYSEFIKAVEFYLRRDDVTEILHIRGMPLDRYLDRGKVWRSMEEGEIVVYVYREVTMMEMKKKSEVVKKNRMVGTAGRRRRSRIPVTVFDDEEEEEDDEHEGGCMLIEFSEIVQR